MPIVCYTRKLVRGWSTLELEKCWHPLCHSVAQIIENVSLQGQLVHGSEDPFLEILSVFWSRQHGKLPLEEYTELFNWFNIWRGRCPRENNYFLIKEPLLCFESSGQDALSCSWIFFIILSDKKLAPDPNSAA